MTYGTSLLNRRIAKTVDGVVQRYYTYTPEGQLIGELDSNMNLVKTFIYASKSHVPDYFIDQNGNSFKIITDHLGSVRFVVDAISGEIVQKMHHDEFGKVLVDTNPNATPFGFAGGLYDFETGLVRFGARDYDPHAGRWTAKDPIRFSGGDENLYGYVLQDPVNKIDPPGTGPVAAALCLAADVGYSVSQGVAEFYNQMKYASLYEKQITDIENQLKSCPQDGTVLNSQLTVLKAQKNAAIGLATNALLTALGKSAAFGVVCRGLLALPGA